MQNKLSDLTKSLEPRVRVFCQGLYPTEGFFLPLLKAAIAKSYEFCLFAISEEGKSNSFFHSATLRGVCEDVISLKYYYSFDPEDREIVAKNLTTIDMLENIETQQRFFKAKKPTQPIIKLSSSQGHISLAKGQVGNLKSKYKWKGDGYRPSVREMAQSCNLLELYDYLYSATSRWVHFSPRILTRMGWGNKNDKKEVEASYSTAHFSEYYAFFNRFYAIYLFILQCNYFKGELNFDVDSLSIIKGMEEQLLGTVRWPELVTFEEMNVKPPAEIIYILRHITNPAEEPE
jgi:hypothetical protein